MKLNHALVLIAALILTPLLHAENLPAPLPEFMDKQQITKWNATQTATASTATSPSEESTQFYTGKPYVADAGGYVYKYRTYNPESAHWNSQDPSGFPDGTNNQAYSPNPTYQVDDDGLATITVNGVSMNISIPSGKASVSVEVPGTKTRNNTGSTESVTYSVTGTTSITAIIIADPSVTLTGGGSITLSTTINVPNQYFADVTVVASASISGGVSYYTQTNTWE
jgi:RHS repeat-associated protein